MKRNETFTTCTLCHLALRPAEGRILWDEGFYRTFCMQHAEELLATRATRRLKKKNAGIIPMF